MAQAGENNLIQRVPPQNKEAERAVLCCCLESPGVLQNITSFLLADDFYEPAHKIIYEVIFDLYSQAKSVDMITVGDTLRKQGRLEKVGGMTYLSSIIDSRALLSNADEYVKIVRQKSLLRKLIKDMDEVLKMSYEGEQEVNNLIEVAISRLANLRDTNRQDEVFQSLKTVLGNTIRDLNNPKPDSAVMSHFSLLDYVTNGFRPGTLTIVAARPAMGKSAFVINIAANVAIKDRVPVAFFSLEMSAKEIGNRILSSRCDISTSLLQAGKGLPQELMSRINSSLPSLGAAPLFIDDHSGLTTTEMLTRCRELKEKQDGKLGLICIDYLQLMSSVNNRSNASRQQEISEISRSLKLMARELDVPIIALSQLSRESEKRDDHRPMLSDLRDSGAIEQDADMVLFIHRPEYYKSKAPVDDESEEENNNAKKAKKRDEDDVQTAEIIVAKNRQGPTKTVYLKWNGSRTTFFEAESKKEAASRPSDADAPPETHSNMDLAFDGSFGSDMFDDLGSFEEVGAEQAGLVPPPEEAPDYGSGSAGDFGGAGDFENAGGYASQEDPGYGSASDAAQSASSGVSTFKSAFAEEIPFDTDDREPVSEEEESFDSDILDGFEEVEPDFGEDGME